MADQGLCLVARGREQADDAAFPRPRLSRATASRVCGGEARLGPPLGVRRTPPASPFRPRCAPSSSACSPRFRSPREARERTYPLPAVPQPGIAILGPAAAPPNLCLFLAISGPCAAPEHQEGKDDSGN